MNGGLINLTCKNAYGLEPFVSDTRLLYHPFHRAISRTSYRADLFRYENRCETIAALKAMPRLGKTWEQCCLDRAREILNGKRSEYILSYSGGIDSTSMLASFLTVATEEEKKKIVLFMSAHSVAENPTFFSRYCAGLEWRSSLQEISSDLEGSDRLLLTGELGDQLFGADLLALGAARYGDAILFEDYRTAAPKIIELQTRAAGTGSAIFEHFHPIVEECPFPIRTAHDFFWWFNFTQKWQHVKYRFVTHSSWDLRARYGAQIAHFFDHPDFQRWSPENHDLKIGKTWDSYKLAAKDFLYAVTGDEAQRKLKKVQSLEKTFVLSENRIAVDSHLRPLTQTPELEAYAL
jgi:hypothetical protein